MKTFSFILSNLALLLVIKYELCNAFYTNKKSEKTGSLNIVVPSGTDMSDGFPEEIEADVPHHGSVKYRKIQRDNHHPIASYDIYLIKDSQAVNQNMSVPDFDIYEEINGTSLATLFKNENSTNDTHAFRMIGTVFLADNVMKHIMPMRGGDNMHGLFDNEEIPANSTMNDMIFEATQEENIEKEPKRVRRADSNGNPINLYVETLVVVDYSTFVSHRTYSGVTDQNLVLLYIRAYFAHMISVTSRVYENSLRNDRDIKVFIRLANFVIATTELESPWTTGTNVGFSGLVGQRNGDGREIIDSSQTLNSLRSFIDSRGLEFDHAVGFFDKDICSSPNSCSVTGLAFVGGVCRGTKYSIVEDNGGFSSVATVAHEIAHNLGSHHDGDGNSCSSSDNFVMSPGSNAISDNSRLFSRCSISDFKSTLLTSNRGAVRSQYQCLTNVPQIRVTGFTNNLLPGQIFSANDQCQQRNGPTSFFCPGSASSMCSALPCSSARGCSFVFGAGAVEGTPCGSGRACIGGVCTASSLAPTTECPFGDLIITNGRQIFGQLPQEQMQCQDAFDFVSTGLNRFAPTYACGNAAFREQCCTTCQRYAGIPDCSDAFSNCNDFASSCTRNPRLSNGQTVQQACPRTCNVCNTQPKTCADNLCQNGAQCVDTATSSDGFTAFRCNCPSGFTGFTCEKADKCASAPCKNGGTCLNFGSRGYVCQCRTGFSGFDCDGNGSSQSTFAPITNPPVTNPPVTNPPATTRAPQTSSPTNCRDSFSNCGNFVSNCHTGATFTNGQTVSEACPVTCNTCTRQETTTRAPQTPSPANCRDSFSNCGSFRSNCNSDARFTNGQTVSEACPVTCGLCVPSTCVDGFSNCPQFSGLCDNSSARFTDGRTVREVCIRTCGVCTV